MCLEDYNLTLPQLTSIPVQKAPKDSHIANVPPPEILLSLIFLRTVAHVSFFPTSTCPLYCMVLKIVGIDSPLKFTYALWQNRRALHRISDLKTVNQSH